MKTIVGIFAHPDDEAFGPGGTLAKLAKDNKVYILCATKGQVGQKNIESEEKLGKIRELELKESAKILGIKRVFFLGFKDGTLSNNLYHKLAGKIQKKLALLRPDMIITYEPQGVSGHIDHITVSMVASYAFEKDTYVKEIWYYGLTWERTRKIQDYFIYFPKGYKKTEFDRTIDVEDVWETKVRAMHAHKSQSKDIERVLQDQEGLAKEENFFIKKKDSNK